MKEATDKHQDAETFCYLHYIYESSNTDAYSQKHTVILVMTQVSRVQLKSTN